MTGAERHTACSRWFNPALIAKRQGCVPMLVDGKLPRDRPERITDEKRRWEERA